MNQYHYLQLEILKKLLFTKEATYSELKFDKNIENSKHTFHLNQLIKDGHVEKVGRKYTLTLKGKEYANTMDTEKAQIQRQGKLSVIQCCIKNTESEPEFLIYTRLKQPFYNRQGYASGKIQYGERAVDAAKRELKEETNLEGEPELIFIEHHLVYSNKTKELLEDKYFYFYRFVNPKGKVKANNEGLFEWVKESELRNYFKRPFETVERLMYITERIKDFNKGLTFGEHNHYTDEF